MKMNCAATLTLIMYFSLQLCTVSAGPERRSYQKDVNDAPVLPHTDGTSSPRGQTHDHWILILVIVGACVFGVMAILMTFWSLYRRLLAVQKEPEIIEMETMLHV